MHKKGMTLLELMVALAVASLVASAAYALLSFGMASEKWVADQFSIQTDLSSAAAFISNKLRFAEKAEIMDEVSDISDGSSYFYMGSKNGKTYIVFKDVSGERYLPLGERGSLRFRAGASGRTVTFDISGCISKTEYNISSEVFLENMPYTEKIISDNAVEGGTVVRFKSDRLV